MPAACGVTLIKRITYRGDNMEEWSNTYWFTGTAPTTQTQWKSLYDALIAEEIKVYLGTSAVVRAYGYNDSAPTATAVDSFDYAAATGGPIQGTLTSTGTYPAGDQAAWIRWKTSRRTTKGKPIYLRKYFHSVPTAESSPSTSDNVGQGWVSAANAFGATLQTTPGVGFGTLTGRGQTDIITGHTPSTFITTRTLERRGKRP